MKTIYNLQKGDNYWRPSPVIDLDKMSGKFEPRKIEIINEIDLLKYKTDLTYGKVSLTKKDCQKSIDYDAALAKIKKYVSEFSDAPDTMSEIVFNSHPQEVGFYVIERNGYVTQSSPLIFKTKNAHRVLKELPNEVQIILGVD